MAQATSDPYPSPLRPGPTAEARPDNATAPYSSPLRPGPATTEPGAAAVEPGQPDQPVVPQLPTLERRQPAGQLGPDLPPPVNPGQAQQLPPQPAVPYVLSPQQTAQLDRALEAWEKRNKEVKSFECTFNCWKTNAAFGTKTTDQGELKYAAPDKGLFKIDGERAEQWICDGKAIFEFDYKNKTMVEHRLPPELQGKAISDGPLPFVFGTDAQKLKQRYFMRIITPDDADGEIWIEAQPRYQRDAADFSRVEIILKTNGLLPYAIQIIAPNKKDRTAYQFDNPVVNQRFRIFGGNWAHPSVPFGWKTVVEEAPRLPAQANRSPTTTPR